MLTFIEFMNPKYLHKIASSPSNQYTANNIIHIKNKYIRQVQWSHHDYQLVALFEPMLQCHQLDIQSLYCSDCCTSSLTRYQLHTSPYWCLQMTADVRQPVAGSQLHPEKVIQSLPILATVMHACCEHAHVLCLCAVCTVCPYECMRLTAQSSSGQRHNGKYSVNLSCTIITSWTY